MPTPCSQGLRPARCLRGGRRHPVREGGGHGSNPRWRPALGGGMPMPSPHRPRPGAGRASHAQ
eukprot:2792319-Alexandrium_andersonii.AAC.1